MTTQRSDKGLKRITAAAAVLLTFSAFAWTQARPDLTELSLESLLDMRVTTASREEEKISETPAAIYVITQDDIQRFGYTSVPEALRMVPGMDVARISGSIWAISARGFNARYADKMLVLIDGRTIYTHVNSGVNWDDQYLAIENIERIEVIRGPGAALWGANAVNGIVNIITKSAKSTTGGLVVIGVGTEERNSDTLRWGGALGKSGAYRFTGKFLHRMASLNPVTGKPDIDSAQLGSAGFRLDWGHGRDSFTSSGSLYNSDLNWTESIPSLQDRSNRETVNHTSMRNGFIEGSWSREYSKTSGHAFQFSFQRSRRPDPRAIEEASSADFDFQQHFNLGAKNHILWGAGFRHIGDDITAGLKLSLIPAKQHITIGNAFLQDEIQLRSNLRATVGAKIEKSGFFTSTLEPNVRLLWTPSSHHSFWGSAASAVNTPSRVDRDSRINLTVIPNPQGLSAELALFGDPNFRNVKMTASETGYRFQPIRKFSIETAAFYNVYKDLLTTEPGTPFFEASGAAPHIVIPLNWRNGMGAETYGAETNANWSATHRWRVSGSYSFLRMQLHRSATSQDKAAELDEGSSPRHQFQIRNSFDLPGNVQADGALYFTGSRDKYNIGQHAKLDLHLGWNVSEKASISLALQNAFNYRDVEFIDTTGSSSTVLGRNAYLKFQWHF